jgi:hypothetical protein
VISKSISGKLNMFNFLGYRRTAANITDLEDKVKICNRMNSAIKEPHAGQKYCTKNEADIEIQK